MYKIVFVDLDDTIRKGYGTTGKWLKESEEIELFDETISRLKEIKDEGAITIGVTNQAGIALGHITHEQNQEFNDRTHELCMGLLDIIFTCPHHMAGNCFCRKPAPGMIFAGVAWANESKLIDNILQNECIMIGDMSSDRDLAFRAGIDFMWASRWREKGLD